MSIPSSPEPTDETGSEVIKSADQESEIKTQELEALDKASEILRPLLRDPKAANRAAARIVAVVEQHSGPIPHPRILFGINEIVPGAAREIVDMAKAEQLHRHRIDNLTTIFPYTGMVSGTVGLLSCIGGAVFMGATGHDNVAISLVAVPVIGAIGILINSRISGNSSQPTSARSTKKPTKR